MVRMIIGWLIVAVIVLGGWVSRGTVYVADIPIVAIGVALIVWGSRDRKRDRAKAREQGTER